MRVGRSSTCAGGLPGSRAGSLDGRSRLPKMQASSGGSPARVQKAKSLFFISLSRASLQALEPHRVQVHASARKGRRTWSLPVVEVLFGTNNRIFSENQHIALKLHRFAERGKRVSKDDKGRGWRRVTQLLGNVQKCCAIISAFFRADYRSLPLGPLHGKEFEPVGVPLPLRKQQHQRQVTSILLFPLFSRPCRSRFERSRKTGRRRPSAGKSSRRRRGRNLLSGTSRLRTAKES